jgi:hypothetical protein
MLIVAAPVKAAPAGHNGPGAGRPVGVEGVHVGPLGAVAFSTQWYEFVSNGAGTMATGCTSCYVGANSTYADAPPWTFSYPGPVTFTITDAFTSGDSFTVLDGGVPVGSTPAVAVGAGCGPDPDTCLANPAISHAVFQLPSGSHSITIRTDNATSSAEAAYFRVQPGGGIPAASRGGVALAALLALAAGVLVLRRSV